MYIFPNNIISGMIVNLHLQMSSASGNSICQARQMKSLIRKWIFSADRYRKKIRNGMLVILTMEGVEPA